jgi:hypothetical protein
MSVDRERGILIASHLGLSVSPFIAKAQVEEVKELNLKEDKHHVYAFQSQRALRRAEKRKFKPRYK